jgi:hypothetical protein
MFRQEFFSVAGEIEVIDAGQGPLQFIRPSVR